MQDKRRLAEAMPPRASVVVVSHHTRRSWEVASSVIPSRLSVTTSSPHSADLLERVGPLTSLLAQTLSLLSRVWAHGAVMSDAHVQELCVPVVVGQVC